jgi:hypothetical protein
MTYELAKKLQDAGFPLEAMRFDQMSKPPTDVRELKNPPTLSELIEACGDKFQLLELQYMPEEDELYPEWMALSTNNLCGVADTPEEAVANLWLVLHA